MLASRMLGLAWRTSRAGTPRCPRSARWYIHDSSPSANMFFARSGVLAGQAELGSSASTVMRGQRDRVHLVGVQRCRRSSGFASYPTLARLRFGELVGVDDDRRRRGAGRAGWPSARPGSSRPARRARRPGSGCRGRRSAAGTRDARAGCPAGARISAGKFGSVDRSLPNAAVSEVNRSPVSCMPSPESPANRMTTRWVCLTSVCRISPCATRWSGLGDHHVPATQHRRGHQDPAHRVRPVPVEHLVTSG